MRTGSTDCQFRRKRGSDTMADIQVTSGVYRIESRHLYLTRGAHAVEHGTPVISRSPMIPPFLQHWRIEQIGDALPGQYNINLEIEPDVFLTDDNTDLLWAKEGTPVAWTFVAGPRGFTIRSQKGLVLSAPTPNAQIKLVDANAPEAGYYQLEHTIF
ncbi:hypothetical protein CTZ27_21625 [Streptomyces griseocarneus]|nr:hypothetical protein CTZ27_21625 [Streptomyces griseocarneus]